MSLHGSEARVICLQFYNNLDTTRFKAPDAVEANCNTLQMINSQLCVSFTR